MYGCHYISFYVINACCFFLAASYSREEPFTVLNIDIRNQQNLHESLEQYVKGDLLEGANAYHCEKCNKKVSWCCCQCWGVCVWSGEGEGSSLVCLYCLLLCCSSTENYKISRSSCGIVWERVDLILAVIRMRDFSATNVRLKHHCYNAKHIETYQWWCFGVISAVSDKIGMECNLLSRLIIPSPRMTWPDRCTKKTNIMSSVWMLSLSAL